jgi:hypothetical protein
MYRDMQRGKFNSFDSDRTSNEQDGDEGDDNQTRSINISEVM